MFAYPLGVHCTSALAVDMGSPEIFPSRCLSCCLSLSDRRGIGWPVPLTPSSLQPNTSRQGNLLVGEIVRGVEVADWTQPLLAARHVVYGSDPLESESTSCTDPACYPQGVGCSHHQLLPATPRHTAPHHAPGPGTVLLDWGPNP